MTEPNWEPHETNTHQDHVIAHVVGATVLGYFTANETAYLLLDIGFIWIIYLDGEMGLVPQSMAIAELEADDSLKSELRNDLRVLERGDETTELERFTRAPGGCLITDVDFQTSGDVLRILINGEDSNMTVETSIETRLVRIC